MKKGNVGLIFIIVLNLLMAISVIGTVEDGVADPGALASFTFLIVISGIFLLFRKRRSRIKLQEERPCCVCGNTPSKFPISDGRICKGCFNEFKDIPGFILRISTIKKSELLNYKKNLDESIVLNDNFKVTKRIGNYIEFDQKRKQFRSIPAISSRNKIQKVYYCDDIIEYELLEDGITVTSGGLGRAAVGGVLLGGVGAIVGGVTGKKKSRSEIENFKIKLTLNDFNNPTVYIELLNKKKIKTNSNKYKEMYEKAQEILSTLAVLQNNKDSNASTVEINKENNNSVTGQLREFKSLLDDGVITEDEFNNKKKELLEI
jgi:hypothetical protein